MSNIGFVGLGHMGLPMALNLIKAGHQVYGYDLSAEAMENFSAHSGITCNTLQQIAENVEVIITMLQTGDQVKTVCMGETGLFRYARPKTLYIDCSSIAVHHARILHKEAEKYHLPSLDSPVSGGVVGAQAATLTFMVGGNASVYTQALPYLEKMGKKIIYTGTAGSGQAAKICNNMILGVSMVAISEAFCLANHLGLSSEKLFEVVNSSSGQCWAMSKYVPVPGLLPDVPANKDYQPGFTANMMLKDLALSQEASENIKLSTSVAAAATDRYRKFVSDGQGNLDFSAIIKAISNLPPE